MRQNILLITLSLSLGCSLVFETPLSASDDTATCRSDAYTATPPFVPGKVTPNVMYMIDNSGSMKYAMFEDTYNQDKPYSGFFEDTYYEYDPNVPVVPGAFENKKNGYSVAIDGDVKGAFVPSTTCTVAIAGKCWEGKVLNWLTTRRIDSARKVLAGGKFESEEAFTYNNKKYYKIVGNNEPSDRDFHKYKGNTTFSIYSPVADGKVRESYDPYAKVRQRGTKLIINDNGATIGEFRKITGVKTGQKVSFTHKDYKNPRIIIGPTNMDEKTTGISASNINLNRDNFQINLETTNRNNKIDLFYMVVENGTHMINGKKIIAGSKNITKEDGTVSFPDDITNAPAVFTTSKAVLPVKHRIEDLNSDGFSIIPQGEQTAEIHYIALPYGSLQLDNDKEDATNNYYTLTIGRAESKVSESANKVTIARNEKDHFASDIVAVAAQDTDDSKSFVFAQYRYGLTEEENEKIELFLKESRDEEDVAYILATETVLTEYNIALIQEDKPSGLLEKFKDSVRQGMSFYKLSTNANSIYDGSSEDGGTSILKIPTNPFVKAPTEYRPIIETPVGTNVTTLNDAVQHMPLVWGTTPLAENFYEVVRYFRQEEPYYTNSNPGHKIREKGECEKDKCFDNWDPYYFADEQISVWCADSNVIIVTDGEPFKDANVPPFNDEGFQIPAPTTRVDAIPYNGVEYSNDYDGNSVSNEFFGPERNESAKNNLDDIALWANKNRAKGTNNKENTRDLRPNDLNNNQFLRTYAVAFGSDASKELLDDTATDGELGSFKADDATTLNNALQAVLNGILDRTSSGSGVSSVSENRASSASLLTQSTFKPSQNITNSDNKLRWAGYLHAYWYYKGANASHIKEDTTDHGYLNVTKDYIIEFNLNKENGTLNIDRYLSNTNGEKIDDVNTPENYQPVKVWDAGQHLHSKRDEKEDTDDDILPRTGMTTGRRVIFAEAKDGTLKEFTKHNKGEFDFTESDDAYASCLGDESYRINNLISYIRGVRDDFTEKKPEDNSKDNSVFTPDPKKGGTCRNRATVDSSSSDPATSTEIWKLGDMSYSTAKAINYGDQTVVFIGTNDGMLHAFNAGYQNKEGLSDDDQVLEIVNTKDDIDSAEGKRTHLGKELWAFIPKNAIPYLQYQADPKLDHIYGVDGTPYFYQLEDKLILIMGMRFGGATATRDTAKLGNIKTPDGNEAGLSSYFALDITDPFEPEFLWEFSGLKDSNGSTVPELGLSYSGPTVITKENSIHVMFLSGPTNFEGTSSQPAQIFILTMGDKDPEDDINHNFEIVDELTIPIMDGSTPLANSFGSRLYNNGLDLNDDRYTDVVVYGIATSQELEEDGTLKTPATGELRALATPGDDPSKWVEKQILDTGEPITSSIVSAPCFEDDFVYFGTGRWFYPLDSMGDKKDTADINALYGVSMKTCTEALKKGEPCLKNFSISPVSVQEEGQACTIPTNAGSANYAWKISKDNMLPRGMYKDGISCSKNPNTEGCIEYTKERVITDPTSSPLDIVFFTTTQPTADVCSLGGRTRMWGLNCMTGGSIVRSDECKDERFSIDKDIVFDLMLQLSGGDINQLGDNFFSNGNLATGWYTGLPPEIGPTLMPTDPDREGDLQLWQEQ